MAKYTVNRACGHEETIVLFGPHKQREWRLENVEPNKLCSECWQKEVEQKRAEETLRAAEEAKESDLPELVGTEKQVAWAERIRIQLLSDFEELYARIAGEGTLRVSLEKIDAAMKSIQQKTSASWWIDHRDASTYELAKILQKELETVIVSDSKLSRDAAMEASAEATVRPESPVTETPAEIRVVGEMVEIIFPEKRDDFREVMKEKLHMEWSGTKWSRKIIKKNGDLQDRAAEAGHRLLAAGFVIRMFDAELKGKSIRGDYEPECTRWIQERTTGEYAGWLAIGWGRDEDFYNAAKKISGARWSKPSVVVPPSRFEEVLDFAKMYNFKVSDMAQEVVQQARRLRDAALTVKVEMPAEPVKTCALGRPPGLEVPVEVGIADEFRDGGV